MGDYLSVFLFVVGFVFGYVSGAGLIFSFVFSLKNAGNDMIVKDVEKQAKKREKAEAKAEEKLSELRRKELEDIEKAAETENQAGSAKKEHEEKKASLMEKITDKDSDSMTDLINDGKEEEGKLVRESLGEQDDGYNYLETRRKKHEV